MHAVHGTGTVELTNSDVGCKTVANMIKGKTPEEIRKLFNITNEYVHPSENITLRFLAFTSCHISPYFSHLQ
jgi:hypothetical protein